MSAPIPLLLDLSAHLWPPAGHPFCNCTETWERLHLSLAGIFPSLLPGSGTLCSWLQGRKGSLLLLSSLVELCVLTSQHVATGPADTFCAHSGASPKVRSCQASRRMASTASALSRPGSGSRPSCLPRCVLNSSVPSELSFLHGSGCCKSLLINSAYGWEHAVHSIA